ncbi:hypothetical protein M8J77_008927 [Diaphorina citri]|nr:hypothetical protein M8J77_008927 [Diaphorina citri]
MTVPRYIRLFYSNVTRALVETAASGPSHLTDESRPKPTRTLVEPAPGPRPYRAQVEPPPGPSHAPDEPRSTHVTRALVETAASGPSHLTDESRPKPTRALVEPPPGPRPYRAQVEPAPGPSHAPDEPRSTHETRALVETAASGPSHLTDESRPKPTRALVEPPPGPRPYRTQVEPAPGPSHAPD